MTVSASSALVSPVLIGRTQALNTLSSLIEQARSGRGQTLLLAGEAGIGKTRLVAEARILAAQRGMLLLDGQCFEPDRALPFAPLLDLLHTFIATHDRGDMLLTEPALAAILPELSPALPAQALVDSPLPEEERRRLFETLSHFLLNAAQAGPRVIVIEDIHWSDESSFAFLLFFARRIATRPVLLVLTYRDDEMPLGLSQFLARLDRERPPTELILERLQPAEMQHLLQAVFGLFQAPRPDFQSALYNLTEGNFFFIEEVLRSLVAACGRDYDPSTWDRTTLESLRIPRTVRVAVQQRAERLSPAARAVLELAAVTGRRFDFALLQALLGTTEAELLRHMKELMAAQLVIEISVDQFAFRHALAREAICDTMLKREVVRCHLAVAETLERLYAGTPQLETFLGDAAYHYFQARSWDKARKYATLAGQRAQRLFAPSEAVEHFTRASQAAGELGQPPTSSLRRARGQAYETLGDFERAAADYEWVLSDAHRARDRQAEWQAQLDLGLLWAARDYQRSGEHLLRALALARALGDPQSLAHSLNRLGNQHLNVDDPLEALACHREALSIFKAANERSGLAETYDLMGMAAYLSGDLVGGTENYERAVDLFREQDERQGLVSSLASLTLRGPTYQTSTLIAAAPADVAARDGEAALSLARDINQRSGEAYALVLLSFCQGPAGEYDLSLASALSGLRIAEGIDHRQWQTAAHCALAALNLDALAWPEALEHAQAGLALAYATASRHWINCATGYLASIYIASDELALARAALGAGTAPHPAARTLGQRLVLAAQAELAVADGNAEVALSLVDQLFASAPNWTAGRIGAIPRLALIRAEALGQLKRWPEAEAELEAARSVAAAEGARSWLWRIHRLFARVYQSEGNLAEAEREAASARAVLAELAAKVADPDRRSALERVAATLAPAERPATPRQRAATAFGGLTPREREVAGLIAQGQSNREAAAGLVVSERTIETHVANILSKLGLSSRTQIAAWAIEKGLRQPGKNSL